MAWPPWVSTAEDLLCWAQRWDSAWRPTNNSAKPWGNVIPLGWWSYTQLQWDHPKDGWDLTSLDPHSQFASRSTKVIPGFFSDRRSNSRSWSRPGKETPVTREENCWRTLRKNRGTAIRCVRTWSSNLCLFHGKRSLSKRTWLSDATLCLLQMWSDISDPASSLFRLKNVIFQPNSPFCNLYSHDVFLQAPVSSQEQRCDPEDIRVSVPITIWPHSGEG